MLRRRMKSSVRVMVVAHDEAVGTINAGTMMTTIADPEGNWTDHYYGLGSIWKWMDWLKDEWESVDAEDT